MTFLQGFELELLRCRHDHLICRDLFRDLGVTLQDSFIFTAVADEDGNESVKTRTGTSLSVIATT